MQRSEYKSFPDPLDGTAIAKYGSCLYTAGDVLCVYDVSGRGIPKLVKKDEQVRNLSADGCEKSGSAEALDFRSAVRSEQPDFFVMLFSIFSHLSSRCFLALPGFFFILCSS